MKILLSHIVSFFDENPSIDEVSKKLFQLGHENEIVGNILDIEFTPNRGDCLSVYGIARDLGVFYTFKENIEISDQSLKPLVLNFKNKSINDCPSISFLNIEIDELPNQYQSYLNAYFEEFAINKNNFFTDISNYLAYEIGQPTHCYDYNEIGDSIEFINSDNEIEFETLLGKKISLSNENCLFFSKNKPINLAGIMGGAQTSCSKTTKNVLIECAYFNPESIISKSVKYDIQSDASYKFERGVDPNNQEKSIRRFIKIVEDHCKINKIELYQKEFKPHTYKRIKFNVSNINKILGTDISENICISHLQRLGFSQDNNEVIVPSYRHDILNENDLAEEIARVIGFDNIDTMEFKVPKKIPANITKDYSIKNFLIKNGFNEVINMPFCRHEMDGSIRIDNPLDKNKTFLRTNLKQSLIDNLIFNENRQKDSIKLFEISDIYQKESEIQHKKILTIIISGRAGENHIQFSEVLDIKYLKNVFKEISFELKDEMFEEVKRSDLKSKHKNKIYLLNIEIDQISDNILQHININEQREHIFNKYKKISEFPSSVRDISFLLNDSKLIKILEDELLTYKSINLKKVFIFDFYKKNHTNIKIGFRFIFQSDDHTLTINQVDDEINQILSIAQTIDGVNVPGLI